METPKPNPATTILYSSFDSIACHCIRFVMAEKDIESNIYHLDIKDMPEEVLEFNPYQTLPTLYDRGLVLYDLLVMLEYLDERFPFPPLLPIDPIERAEKRQLLFRFYRAPNAWHQLIQTLLSNANEKTKNAARLKITTDLNELAPLFSHQPYFKSDDFSVVDAFLAAIFLRFKVAGIELSPKTKPVRDYAQRLFAKKSFKASLTDIEKEYQW